MAAIRAIAAVVVLVGCFALAALAFPLQKFEPYAADVRAPDLTATVMAASSDLAATVEATLVWADGQDLYLGAGAAGTVTDVHQAGHDPLECGQPFIEVDGRPIIVYCGSNPPWRQVDSQTRGEDADEIVAGLTDDKHDSIEDFQRSLGLPPDGTIEPRDLMWVPGGRDLAAVSIVPGQQVSDQVPVARLDPILRRIGVDVTPFDGAPVTFQVAGTADRYAVDDDGSVDASSELTSVILGASEIGGDAPSTVQGVLRLVTPVETLAVPAGSIIQDGDTTCVVSDAGEPRRVEIVASNIDGVQVTGDLSAGDVVLVEPEPTGC